MKPIRTLSLLLVLSGFALGAQTPAAAPAQGTGTGPGARATQPRTAAGSNATGGMTLKEVRDAFAKADADRSGSLSVDEAAFGGLDGAGFTAGDADGDGRLSQDEYVVASELRVARLSGGAASDLTAESTRLQTLRRARQAEALKTRREAAAGSATPQAGAASGPAAARRALAPEQAAPTAPVPGAKATAENPADLQEIRASIVRRLRNGEITEADAQTAIEAIDRRIALATGTAEAPKPAAPEAAAASAAGEKKVDLRAIEDSLNRRIRNSDIPTEQAAGVYEDTLRRIESARGATPPAPSAPRQPPAVPGAPGAPGVPTDPADPADQGPEKPQGFRAKITEAQSDLTRRMRNAELTPEQAEALRSSQAKRIRGAVGTLAGESTPGPAAPAAVGAAPAAAPGSEPSATAPSPARVPARADGAAPAAPATGARTADPATVAPIAPGTPGPAATAPQPPRKPEVAPAQPPAAEPARPQKPAQGGAAPTPSGTRPARPAPAAGGGSESPGTATPPARPARPASGG